MNNTKITADTTITTLREIVAEFGPDTKRECKYVEYPEDEQGWRIEGSEPIAAHCIVGIFLNRQGVPLNVLEASNAQRIIPIARDIVKETGIDLFEDPRVLTILDEAQSLQDAGYHWGKALEGAERVYAGEPSEADDVRGHWEDSVSKAYQG
jgi:hypothetical protein